MDRLNDLTELLPDSSRQTADVAVSIVRQHPDLFKQILDFAMEDKDRYAMRAARVVNLCTLENPDLFRPYVHQVIRKLPGLTNNGLKRGLAKTLSERSFEFEESSISLLVDTCFGWLNDPAEKVALKAYAMDILYKISLSYPELNSELLQTLELIEPYSSVGIKSRIQKLVLKLRVG